MFIKLNFGNYQQIGYRGSGGFLPLKIVAWHLGMFVVRNLWLDFVSIVYGMRCNVLASCGYDLSFLQIDLFSLVLNTKCFLLDMFISRVYFLYRYLIPILMQIQGYVGW